MNRLNDKIQPGMAIVAKRPAYDHYGISTEVDGRLCVIHYIDDKRSGVKGKISQTSLRDFQQGDELRIEDYDGLGYSYARRKTSLDRAVSRMGEQEYNVFTNNCEHFATWCVTGESRSRQVEKFVGGAAAWLNKVATEHPWVTLGVVAGTIFLASTTQRR